MSSSNVNPDQPSRAASIAAVVILLLIFLTPAVGFWWLRGMAQEMMERNSLSHTRDMLFRHVSRTRGEWPNSWDDLEEDFEPTDANYGTPSLDVLKQIVEVDFSLGPESVGEEGTMLDDPPRVIWLKGRSDTDDVREVNARIAIVLRQHRQ